MINTNWPSRIQGHESICFIQGLFSIQIKTHNEEFYWGWEVFSVFFRIYESFYEISVNIIGSEGSANGQLKVDNWDGFVKISPEILYGLWYNPSYYVETLTVHQTLINYIFGFDDDICFWVNLGNLKNLFLQNSYSISMLTYNL